jgi:hypothetical protein
MRSAAGCSAFCNEEGLERRRGPRATDSERKVSNAADRIEKYLDGCQELN